MLPRFNVKNGQISHLHNLLFITGAESHPELPAMLQATGRPSELPTIFAPNRTVGDMSDHGIFRRNGNPYLFLSCGRWQHYHEPSDTPDRLNYDKMALIATYTEQLMRGLGTCVLAPCTESESDTVELELAGLRKVFGPGLPVMLMSLGVDQLEDRADLDRFADALMSFGL